MGKRNIVDEINSKYPMKYACKIIEQVNKEEKKSEGQKHTSKRGMIKVSGIIHQKSNKIDPRMAWLMIKGIYLMCHDINNKE